VTERCGWRTDRAGTSAWIQLLEVYEYRDRCRFYFAEEVHSLTFPSPWLKQCPTVYEVSRAKDALALPSRSSPTRRALRASSSTSMTGVVNGTECRTPRSRPGWTWTS